MDLKKYIKEGKTFNEYYSHVIDYDTNGDINDPLHKFYSLNNTRMNRLQKRFKLSPNSIDQVKNLNQHIHLIIITEGWCGDAAQILPIIEKLCQSSEYIHEHIFLRDENLELIDSYLTNGGRAIPIVIGVNEAGKELFKWGPRPEWAQPILSDYKNDKMSKDEFIQEIQKKYNKDKGITIEQELINLILQ